MAPMDPRKQDYQCTGDGNLRIPSSMTLGFGIAGFQRLSKSLEVKSAVTQMASQFVTIFPRALSRRQAREARAPSGGDGWA